MVLALRQLSLANDDTGPRTMDPGQSGLPAADPGGRSREARRLTVILGFSPAAPNSLNEIPPKALSVANRSSGGA